MKPLSQLLLFLNRRRQLRRDVRKLRPQSADDLRLLAYNRQRRAERENRRAQLAPNAEMGAR